MLDKRLAATVAAMAIVTAITVVAALLPQNNDAMPMQETVSDVPADDAFISTPPEREQLYVIREHNGFIAVFEGDSQTPVLVLDKLVKHLPEYDRMQMRDGIEIFTEEELAARIEDFIS